MTPDEKLFLQGKIESLKRQLAECKKIRERCKNKSTALAAIVKRLMQLNDLKPK